MKQKVWILKRREISSVGFMYWITEGVYSSLEKAKEDAITLMGGAPMQITVEEEYLGATIRDAQGTIQHTITEWDVI